MLQALKTAANNQNLKLINTSFTRYQGSDAPSTIDIILTNVPHLISTPTLIESTSDHKIVLFDKKILVKPNVPQIRKARIYKNYTKEKMLQTLNIPLLNQLLSSTDVNKVADSLTEEIVRALDIIAPICTTQIRTKYAPHLSQETKTLMTKRDKIKTEANMSKLPEKIQEYKTIRNLTLKRQRADKLRWAENLINKKGNESKMLWQAAKRISGDTAQKSVDSLIVDNVMIKKPEQITDSLNKYFVKKVDDLVAKMPTPTINILDVLENTPTPEGEQM